MSRRRFTIDRRVAGSLEIEGRGVVLALRFEPMSGEAPRPEEIASVFEDVEGLYRVVPTSLALGLPIAELLSEYRSARADIAAESFPWALERSEWKRLRPRMPPEIEEFFHYFVSRGWRHGWGRPYWPRTLLPPENAMRVRRLSMESPLELVALIPSAYCVGYALEWFLRSLEERFNMAERIRTERVDLKAKRAERRADAREAEVREARAARELAGLRQEGGPFRLIDGEVRPDEGERGPPRRPE